MNNTDDEAGYNLIIFFYHHGYLLQLTSRYPNLNFQLCSSLRQMNCIYMLPNLEKQLLMFPEFWVTLGSNLLPRKSVHLTVLSDNTTIQILQVLKVKVKWHAGCMNVHQTWCPLTECSFHFHKPSPMMFQRIWQCLTNANWNLKLTSVGNCSPWWSTFEEFSSWMNPGLLCTSHMQTVCVALYRPSANASIVNWTPCWGYGMGRRKLKTMSMDALNWWHFDCTEMPWQDPLSFAAITSCCSLAPFCKDLYTIPGSWKLPSSCMAFILTTCHALSMFGMLWNDAYDSTFQFLPKSSNKFYVLWRWKCTLCISILISHTCQVYGFSWQRFSRAGF